MPQLVSATILPMSLRCSHVNPIITVFRVWKSLFPRLYRVWNLPGYLFLLRDLRATECFCLSAPPANYKNNFPPNVRYPGRWFTLYIYLVSALSHLDVNYFTHVPQLLKFFPFFFLPGSSAAVHFVNNRGRRWAINPWIIEGIEGVGWWVTLACAVLGKNVQDGSVTSLWESSFSKCTKFLKRGTVY